MDLPGIKSANGMLDMAETSAQQTRLTKLAASAEDPQASRENLVAAAKEFEGVFLNTLMKAMRKTVPDNKLFNSSGPTKFYQQMHDTEIAKALATGHSGMGISDLIIQQFEATVEARSLADQETGGPVKPVIQPRHPVIGPPAPQAMERYNSMSSVGEIMAARQKLRFFASRQSTAAVDTLDRFETDISRAAVKTGLEPSLILAVVLQESGGDPDALSPKGAQGLMQLMPGTAREMGVNDVGDPRENLLGGAGYLAKLMERFEGDLDLALAAYNAGPGNVDKAGPGIPDFPETQNYVASVKAQYTALGGGMDLANEKKGTDLEPFDRRGKNEPE